MRRRKPILPVCACYSDGSYTLVRVALNVLIELSMLLSQHALAEIKIC